MNAVNCIHISTQELSKQNGKHFFFFFSGRVLLIFYDQALRSISASFISFALHVEKHKSRR